MAQYIDKAVIVMIIEKLIAKYKEISVGIDKKGNDWVDSVSMLNAKIDTLQSLLSIIYSLEVKEVDLDNELDFIKDAYYYFTSDERSSMKKVARHFFELGLKAQKGEYYD